MIRAVSVSDAALVQRFELVHCKRCGAVIGTKEQIEEAARRSDNEPDYLCDDCRKERMAKVMADTYGFDI